MKPFAVEIEGVNITIVEARSIKIARNYAKSQFGAIITKVTKATEDDVSWVKGMGGRIHKAS